MNPKVRNQKSNCFILAGFCCAFRWSDLSDIWTFFRRL